MNLEERIKAVMLGACLRFDRLPSGQFGYVFEHKEFLRLLDGLQELISDILREVIGEGDDNPKYGGMVNFASNAPEEKDILEAKSQAFEYGFRMGWRTCWFEIRHRARKLGLEV